MDIELIAIAHRPVKDLPGTWHYSLQKWTLSLSLPPSGNFSLKPYPNVYNIDAWLAEVAAIGGRANKAGSLELMYDETFEVCVQIPPPVGFCVSKTWRLSTIHIQQPDSGTELSFLVASPALPWDEGFVKPAKSYTWAWKDTLGQVVFPSDFSWIQWEYQIPVLDGLKARNSNTFARYIMKKFFGQVFELQGLHPGADYPEDSTNPGYCGIPFKEGTCIFTGSLE